MEDESGISPLLRLVSSFRKARIPYLIIGMGSAVLQGVPVVTRDLDFWIGWPLKRHDEILVLCFKLGATIIDDFKVELPDLTLVNFTYQVAGLKSFREELKGSRRLRIDGQTVPVLPLERIRASKKAVNRPKDKVHIFYLEQAMRLIKKLKKQ